MEFEDSTAGSLMSQPMRPASPQAAQVGQLLQGPGGKRECKLYTPVKLTPMQMDAVARAKKYAMEQSVRGVLLKQSLQMSQIHTIPPGPFNPMGCAQITDQVWTKLGTIYVGNINFDVTEEILRQAFSPFGPVKKVSLSWDAIANKHRGYSFVEYDVPEAAFLALDQMNGVVLNGRNIKVGRPSNMPQAQPIIEKLMEEAKPYNRIYIASIHTDLSENDIQSVFEAFGTIKSCKLSQDMVRPGKHRGFGYIQFETAQSAMDAVVSMNLFNLGGQFLRVGKAVTPPNTQQVASFPTPMPTAAAVAAAAVTAKITAMDAVSGTGLGLGPPGVATLPQLSVPGLNSLGGGSRLGSMPLAAGLPPPAVVVPTVVATQGVGQVVGADKREADDDVSIASQENMAISGTQARHMVMQKLMRQSESRVMVLKNMVGAADVDDDLESEVIDECSTYGDVNRVVIYQEKQSDDDDAEIIVKIFVEFKEPSGVEKAVKALNGRYFAGRQVRADPYDQALFDSNELTA